MATLEYVEAHPGITSLAIVPLGFTKHQHRFTASYSDDVETSRAVVHMLEPFQERARATRGSTVFQLADEFYIDAELPVPPAETYDGFPQFYDGIGMLRSFLDEVEQLRRSRPEDIARAGERLISADKRVLITCGEAAQSTFDEFCRLFTPAGLMSTHAIKNEYFGGNVNVTGLICACDLLGQLPRDLSNIEVLIPNVMFNYDGLTLDGQSRESVTEELIARGAIVRYATPRRRTSCRYAALNHPFRCRLAYHPVLGQSWLARRVHRTLRLVRNCARDDMPEGTARHTVVKCSCLQCGGRGG